MISLLNMSSAKESRSRGFISLNTCAFFFGRVSHLATSSRLFSDAEHLSSERAYMLRVFPGTCSKITITIKRSRRVDVSQETDRRINVVISLLNMSSKGVTKSHGFISSKYQTLVLFCRVSQLATSSLLFSDERAHVTCVSWNLFTNRNRDRYPRIDVSQETDRTAASAHAELLVACCFLLGARVTTDD